MQSRKVGIVAYGLGNIGSLARSLARTGCDVEVLSSPRAVRGHSHLVVPGVGHFGTAVRLLAERGWDEELVSARDRGLALLGICLGMQLLTEGSSEAPSASGLGFIPGRVEHLRDQGCQLRTPHVGWNSVSPLRDSTLLGDGLGDEDFYFVHSFALGLPHAASAASAEYGVGFSAVIENGNVFGVQFHPEKSSSPGRALLTNFARYQPC